MHSPEEPKGWTDEQDRVLALLRDPAATLVIRPHEYGPITRSFVIAYRNEAPSGGIEQTGLCMVREWPTP